MINFSCVFIDLYNFGMPVDRRQRLADFRPVIPVTVVQPGSGLHAGSVVQPDSVVQPGSVVQSGSVVQPGSVVQTGVQTGSVIFGAIVLCAARLFRASTVQIVRTRVPGQAVQL